MKTRNNSKDTKRMIGEVNLEWDISEMDGSGYAQRATMIEGTFLECKPLPPNSGLYGAYIGGKRVLNGKEYDMPDGAMQEAEETFKTMYPVLTVAGLTALIDQPCKFEGFTVCGFIAIGHTITFSAWGKKPVGVLYDEIKYALHKQPVGIKIALTWTNDATRNSWYTVSVRWIY